MYLVTPPWQTHSMQKTTPYYHWSSYRWGGWSDSSTSMHVLLYYPSPYLEPPPPFPVLIPCPHSLSPFPVPIPCLCKRKETWSYSLSVMCFPSQHNPHTAASPGSCASRPPGGAVMAAASTLTPAGRRQSLPGPLRLAEAGDEPMK